MEYKLVKIGSLSGTKSSIFTLLSINEGKTLYDKFILENSEIHRKELININERIKVIGKKVGAREQFFRLHEGAPGDGICALYDDPDANLRLYCIRYGTFIIILGSGGFKSKEVHAFQEVDKLKDENYLLREISKQITQKMKEKDLKFSDDLLDFEGDMTFLIED